MSKSNPNDIEKMFHKAGTVTYDFMPMVSKGFAPFAGASPVIGNDTMGYQNINPRLYEGLSGDQFYGLTKYLQGDGDVSKEALGGNNSPSQLANLFAPSSNNQYGLDTRGLDFSNIDPSFLASIMGGM